MGNNYIESNTMSPLFDYKEYKRLINLKFFYSQENNLVMVGVVQKQMDDMIGNDPGPSGY